jgi:threonine dehydrogenase-like Zn-dependent dehydrogenase
MADSVVVVPSCVVSLPSGLPPGDAALAEPMAVAVHACARGGVEPGGRVAIVGGGTIGLCCAVAAQHVGADADIVARHPAQLAAAEQLGIGRDVDRAYDVVVVAAATSTAFDDATRLARRGGTLVFVATTWQPIEVSFLAAQMHELTLVPTFVYGHSSGGRDFDVAAALLAARPEIPAALITHRFPLDDAAHAFAVAADRASGAIKVVLEPE